ncbi:MAG: hypothetical protein IJU71_08115 [Selenomonadaceae bacterium]|nr:hypothetical protein [Selenomonadaceae bacterium]
MLRLMIGVPLYAANYEQHNEIVGSANAFQQTVEGLFNLYRFDLPIEIRIVVFKYNYAWLMEFADFIWRSVTRALLVERERKEVCTRQHLKVEEEIFRGLRSLQSAGSMQRLVCDIER